MTETAEISGVMPSAMGITCPAGCVQHPEDVSGLKVNGGRYNHFHWFTQGVIDIFQAFLGSDFDHGWELAALIWCAPVAFRDPSCLGILEGAVESGPANLCESYAQYIQTLSGGIGTCRLSHWQQLSPASYLKVSAAHSSCNSFSAAFKASALYHNHFF